MRYLSLSLLFLLVIPLIGLQEADAANWYNSSWLKARKITIDQTDIDSDLTNYPLYVNMTSVNIGTDAQADCDDFVFTDSTNVTKFDHEIETCDSTNDWAEFWVEIPTVTGASDTILFMYYDNAGATEQQTFSATWNSNYKAVYHLNGTFTDSTSNVADCSNSGSSAVTDEYIGDSRSFDGVDDVIDCNSPAATDDIWTGGGSISIWLNPNNGGEGASGRLLNKREISVDGWDTNINNEVGNYENFEFFIQGENGGVADYWRSTNKEVKENQWNFITITYDRDSAANVPIFYMNGSSVAITTLIDSSTTISSDASNELCIGNMGGGASCLTINTFNGELDEARLNTVILTAPWIRADWECQKGATLSSEGPEFSCITVGAQGTEPISAVTISDDFAIEDTASASLMGVVTISDDFAIEDTATTTSGDTATVSDDFAIEDTAVGLAPGVANISDEFAIEDIASAFSSTAIVSDDFAIEDVTSSSVEIPTRNTIVLRVVKNPFEFRIYNDATRMTCEMSIQGGVIFNTQDLNLNICNGTMWILPDGSPT